MPLLGNSIALGRVKSGGAWWDRSALAHWRSDNGLTLVDGDTEVSSWLSGGDEYDLLQSVDADQPTYTASDSNFNNVASVTGDGVTEWIREDAGASTVGALIGQGEDTPFTWMFSFRQISGTNVEVVGWADSTESNDFRMSAFVHTSGVLRIDRRSTALLSRSSAIDISGGVAQVITVEFVGTTLNSWVDNVAAHVAVALDTSTMSTNPDRFGLFDSPRSVAPAVPSNSAFVEMRVYEGVLSTADREAAQIQMANYAGVTL